MSETLNDGECQAAETLDGIRADHKARYRWAANRLKGQKVVDAACGVGYGSAILSEAGCEVRAYDRNPDAIEIAEAHYNHDPRVDYAVGDLYSVEFPHAFDAVVCFEALEHVAHPERILHRFRGMAPRLLVSVPNQAVMPYAPNMRHHMRHYRQSELEELLALNGWRVKEWWGQADKDSDVTEGAEGRTLIAVADRAEFVPMPVPEPVEDPHMAEILKHFPDGVPNSVAIVAMGPSAATYYKNAAAKQNRRRLVDETWAIGGQGPILQHDRFWQMDDIKIQQARIERDPDSSIAALLDWSLGDERTTPYYTSRAYGLPGVVEYPLEAVVNLTGHAYFRNTVPYPVAFAIAAHVAALHYGLPTLEELHLYGCDYSYPNDPNKREEGRANLEFWIALAVAAEIKIVLPEDGTLLGAREGLYGYDTEWIEIVHDDERGYEVARVDRDSKDIPSALEMECRYSHDARVEQLGKEKFSNG